jgi:hypothetical protein
MGAVSKALVLACSASLLLLPGLEPVLAYTGGPVRLTVGWYHASDSRVYFRRLDHMPADNHEIEVLYFELDGVDPTKAKRSSANVWGGPAAGGQGLKDGEDLVPLEVLSDFELSYSVQADSVGVEERHGGPIYSLRVAVTANGATGHLVAEAFCQSLVRVRGLYRVPGRQELLMVVSYIGRAYGCKEIEEALVLITTP